VSVTPRHSGEFPDRECIHSGKTGLVGRKKRKILDLTANPDSRCRFLHPDDAHATMQIQASLRGAEPRRRDEDRTLNALTQRKRHIRNPVDPVTTEIHGGGFQSRAFGYREELHGALQPDPFTLPPFPGRPFHGLS